MSIPELTRGLNVAKLIAVFLAGYLGTRNAQEECPRRCVPTVSLHNSLHEREFKPSVSPTDPSH